MCLAYCLKQFRRARISIAQLGWITENRAIISSAIFASYFEPQLGSKYSLSQTLLTCRKLVGRYELSKVNSQAELCFEERIITELRTRRMANACRSGGPYFWRFRR